MLVSSLHVTVLGKATKCFITLYLFYTTLPNYNKVTKISAHIPRMKFHIFNEVNRKFKHAFFLFSFIQRCVKGNQEMLPNHVHVGAYRVVETIYCVPPHSSLNGTCSSHSSTAKYKSNVASGRNLQVYNEI